MIDGEDFGEVPPSNFEKTNSGERVRRVPAVVRGGCTSMDAISGMMVRRGRSKRRSNVTCVHLAVGLFRFCRPIDYRIEPFGLSGCRGILISGRGSRLQAWTLRPESWRPVASDERGVR